MISMTLEEKLNEAAKEGKMEINLKLKFRGEGVILGPDGKEKGTFIMTGEQKDGNESIHSAS